MEQEQLFLLKARIRDGDVLSYIAELERENDRLYSHHSACKEELGHLVELANKWRFKALAAEQLATYFNSLYLPGSVFMSQDDVKREIEFQGERLYQQHFRGITFEDKIECGAA